MVGIGGGGAGTLKDLQIRFKCVDLWTPLSGRDGLDMPV